MPYFSFLEDMTFDRRLWRKLIRVSTSLPKLEYDVLNAWWNINPRGSAQEKWINVIDVRLIVVANHLKSEVRKLPEELHFYKCQYETQVKTSVTTPVWVANRLVPLTDKSGVLKVIQPGIVCVWVMLIWTYAMEEAGACYGSGSWLTSDNYLHQDTISTLGCPLQISVLVFSGETGCGKTTQLPQSILQEEISFLHGADCNIICTQPRRISAISVAARICSEKGEDLGDTVGYQIPVQSKRYHT
ncbi:hypothetical protein FXO37_22745 [Capsicum annuum]|nr:hypothetical protein FXO37_22745 [Capsicum annuum]